MKRSPDARFRPLPIIVLAALPLACGSLDPRAGMECETVHDGSAGVQASLDGAASGDCVLLGSGTYTGGLRVPGGVTLGAARGAEVRIAGSDGASSTVRLEAAASLWGVTIDAGGDHGVVIPAGSVSLHDVVIDDAALAILAYCEGEDCRTADRRVSLHDVTTRGSRVGLWAYGASVQMVGGQHEDHGSTNLTGGYAVIASHGAHLEVSGTEVRQNGVGILVDGEATTAVLTDVQVVDNLGRGIWAQGLRGTLDTPALRIEGTATRIEGNRLVGVGARDALGIIIVDSRVAGTEASTIQVDGGAIAEVGDGIGLFADTGDVRIEGSEIEENVRAQILVDEGAHGIIIVDSLVGPGEHGHGIVIQDTSVDVEMSEELEAQSEYDLGLAIASGALVVPDLDDTP